MALDLTYINAAALRVGEEAITDASDGSPLGKIASHNYELLVRAELGKHRWRFASKTVALNAISGTPDEPWLYAYTAPTDLMLLRTVKAGGKPIPYEQMYNKVLTDTDPDTGVIAHYAWRPPESYWPPFFGEIIIRRLEAMILRSIKERHDEAKERDTAAEVQFREARRLDSQSSTPVDPWTSPALEARRG